MAKIGYVRVSTIDQNPARQQAIMNDLGVERVYMEKLTGTNANRPALQEMMQGLQSGDSVYVESISRFARNTIDLLELVGLLNDKGVEFVSQKEKIDTTTPQGKFMLKIFGAVAELERDYTMQRQAEGIAIAKENGVYSGDNWTGRQRTEVCPDMLEKM